MSKTMDKQEALKILGLEEDDPSEQVITEAYRRKALKVHPDKNPDKDGSEFIELKNATIFLLNSKPNASYNDEFLNSKPNASYNNEFLNILKEFEKSINEIDIILKDIKENVLQGQSPSPEKLVYVIVRCALAGYKKGVEDLLEKFPNNDFDDYLNVFCEEKNEYEKKCHGHTALTAGSVNGEDFIKFLLDKGAKANVPNKKGRTILHEYMGSIVKKEFIKFLLDKLANENLQDGKGDNPLNLQDEEGNTPLHLLLGFIQETKNTNTIIFTENYQYEMVKWLLEEGADADIKNKHNEKPKDYVKYGTPLGKLLGVRSYCKAVKHFIFAGVFLFIGLQMIYISLVNHDIVESDGITKVIIIISVMLGVGVWFAYSAYNAAFNKPSSEFNKAVAKAKEKEHQQQIDNYQQYQSITSS